MISFLAVLIGLLVVFLAFIASYLGDNIIVVTTECSPAFAHQCRSDRLISIDSLSNLRCIRRAHSRRILAGLLRPPCQWPSEYAPMV